MNSAKHWTGNPKHLVLSGIPFWEWDGNGLAGNELLILALHDFGASSEVPPIFGFGEIAFWGFPIGQFSYLAGVGGLAVGGALFPDGWGTGWWEQAGSRCAQASRQVWRAACRRSAAGPNYAQKIILIQGVVRNIPDTNLLWPIHFEAIRQRITKDCHLDTLAVQAMLTTEFWLSVSKTLVYKVMVDLGFSWKVLGVSLYDRNSNKTIED
ncbi:hypothetical protein DSO57_1035400 [Entomophthora muscae]|uniref:Uncharacterized protein n=1 Tax=Entomophthora muscae TaxID=34485 RepID=A0ACC2SNV6_9FUNG|nr:hypothetical protein DSO57_1035400 [Entomophthora muscae]